MEPNLLLFSHSAESQMSPVTNIACLEFADGAGETRNLRVALCGKKHPRQLDSE